MRKLTGRLLLAFVVLVVVAVLAVWLLLRGSLPWLDGERALPGAGAAVRIERDALGVVTIDAASRADAMRALGYVHAQERYFEMDLMRRSPAGELSALFGGGAIELDKAMRVHRLRARVQANLDTAIGNQAANLQAYRDGVNAGLGDLRTRPWAYLLLRQTPQAWTLEDSILVGLAMYADLQDPRNQRELAMARIRDSVPPALYTLLAHPGTEWDAPLSGPALGNAVLPDAATLDLRALAGDAKTALQRGQLAGGETIGSNNFAVDGSLTADGRAILADDMHLGLRAPNIWFRARLRYPDPAVPGGQVDVSGFTLPGLPAVIVGSNGHVAWGFTNSYIDTADFARLPADAPLRSERETIAVAGGAAVTLDVRESAWGPVLHEEPDGRLLALRWAAHLPGAVRLDFADMAQASDIDSARAIADRSGIPAQNLLLADAGGRIGWRVGGARPDRVVGCTPEGIVDAGGGCAPWSLRSDAAPALIDPPGHRLWTANTRVVDAATFATVGDAGYDLGARGAQIRDDLLARERFAERDLLDIQLDDRAVLLQRWHALLREVVAGSDDPALKPLDAVTRQWTGRASIDAVDYRVVRAFRDAVIDMIGSGLLAPAKATLGDAFIAPRLAQLEGTVWPLLQQRPAHLLPPPHASWDALLADAARATERELAETGPDLAARTWGERNTTAICHPVSMALPTFIGQHLCMPAQPLPGDRDMPRVQGKAFGASQRMVVSPGHEADGIIHMPGGQSGHPLSPYWGSGHADWAEGRVTPFLPGKAEHVLTLRPH